MKVTDDFQSFGITHPAVIKLPISNALRGVVCALSEPIMLIDMRGMIFAAKPAVSDVLEVHYEFLLGKMIWPFIDYDRQAIENTLKRLAFDAAPLNINGVFRVDSSIPETPVALRLKPVKTGPETGAPLIIVAQLFDRHKYHSEITVDNLLPSRRV